MSNWKIWLSETKKDLATILNKEELMSAIKEYRGIKSYGGSTW